MNCDFLPLFFLLGSRCFKSLLFTVSIDAITFISNMGSAGHGCVSIKIYGYYYHIDKTRDYYKADSYQNNPVLEWMYLLQTHRRWEVPITATLLPLQWIYAG